MANCSEFKAISKARLKSVEILIGAGDWEGAAYFMPYVLECALKAVVCKTLHLIAYPDSHKNEKDEKVRGFFMTHVFVQLLVISGMQDIFGPNGPSIPYRYWSDFTIEYPARWVEMRYNTTRMAQFDEIKVKDLYNKLTDPKNGILTVIERNGRW